MGGMLKKSAGCGSRWRPASHREHGFHVRDAGGIPVGDVRIERRRELPSRKQGMRCVVRCATGDRKAWGTRGERTSNMKRMSVTPEVSQLEMSALTFLSL